MGTGVRRQGYRYGYGYGHGYGNGYEYEHGYGHEYWYGYYSYWYHAACLANPSPGNPPHAALYGPAPMHLPTPPQVVAVHEARCVAESDRRQQLLQRATSAEAAHKKLLKEQEDDLDCQARHASAWGHQPVYSVVEIVKC